MIALRNIVRDSNMRYINNDRDVHGERLWFAIGEYQQHVMVIPESDFKGRHLYKPPRRMVDEVIEHLDEITGLDIPEAFLRGLNIHLVNGVLYHGGIAVPTRILRQQIFFGSMTTPYTEEIIHMALFQALGNALWNYIDFRIWGGGRPPAGDDDGDQGINFPEKSEYRNLRNYSMAYPMLSNRAERDLFYVASEDFRYLFGDSAARRGEWFLPSEFVDAPNPEVVNFWRRELKREPNQRT